MQTVTTPLNQGYPGYWKIVVWERENFQGRRQEFTSECCNITQCGFDNVRSIQVESGA
ncbi:hypothetical protein chiPu_0025207, partial [Chiloscyllium punctatum]|nr:hypothetical protein [Chiloscyllium punctatum]